MSATATASFGLQFLLELAALAALGYWGFGAGGGTATCWLLGVGAPALAALFWAVFGSPRAPLHARGAGRLHVEGIFFGSAVLALAAANQLWLAIGLGALLAGNIALLRLLRRDG